jgi:hypothetical protein
MQFREIITVYSENQTKPINVLCEKKMYSFKDEEGGTHSNHCYLNG